SLLPAATLGVFTLSLLGVSGAHALSPAPLNVYTDSLQNGWQNWSWAATNPRNLVPVHSGKDSIRVTTAPWQALFFHHAPFNSSPYGSVSFWINGGATSGQRLQVQALLNGQAQAAVAVPGPPANGWRQVTIPLSALGAASKTNFDGFWIQDASGRSQPAFYVDDVALTAATGAPAMPTNFTAVGQWAAQCPKCGGMAMPHCVLAWVGSNGTNGYNVYRDGVVLQANVTDTGYTDMTVVSGQTYAYAVSAVGAGGESEKTAPANATAPFPPVAGTGMLTAPTDLTIAGLWQGAPTDALAWSPVPGASGYNVYANDVLLAKNVAVQAWPLPAGLFWGGSLYTVTALDAMGMETLPSNIVGAQGASDPHQPPDWKPGAPPVPSSLVGVSEWNAGGPRIRLAWQGDGDDWTYTVYRDRQKIASGIWGLTYLDTTVQPGEMHSYTVSGTNVPWTHPVESKPSAAVSVRAISAAPAHLGSTVQITGIAPNDDSAVVSFAAVPGAVDYRAYTLANPSSIKYSGGSLSIEMNGLDPIGGADIVVEAVDKFGPFQKMDGMAGPGAMQVDGAMHVAINGQGDPSNIPNALAASDPIHVVCQAATLSGGQAFFDTFRNEAPFVEQIVPAVQSGSFYGDPANYREYANDKWTIRDYGGDLTNTRIFAMGSHFMDTLYDGGGPASSDPPHNNNASLVLMPKATADISGGRVLHVTFEVDPHFDSRRWCEVHLAQAGDLLIEPGKVDPGNGPLRVPT
ncbi:MAG: hypothetical protein M3Y13_04870, partial [Armatimonadota bacterium]|nr:hypothetical protein [Armatimonadota bacterium]